MNFNNIYIVLLSFLPFINASVLSGILLGPKVYEANPDAKRLYDDLLSNYNRLIRPVVNNTETLTVWLGLKLSQLIEMNLKNQVMTTNVWVEQKWFDYKLQWDPMEYGGVEMLYVPSENIWLPDIVLYNNADGNYEVTLMTKATLKYNGEVYWKPPAIYKSSCEINVEYFPFDEQSCLMKFGSWTYNGAQVDLKHMQQQPGSNLVATGIDLNEFYLSVEWDILEVPASRNEEYYPCCVEPYSDITFNITMRRKTLFYTVNLIIPCVGITFLTVLVFYLPSDSGEKVSLCSSILLSLTVFFLLLAEIIPPTSLAIPLLGKYLLFTMILVTLSIWITVVVLNVHFRSPTTHKMSKWVRKLFLHWMPRLLMMRRTPYATPEYTDIYGDNESEYTTDMKENPDEMDRVTLGYKNMEDEDGHPHGSSHDSDNILLKHVIEDWKYVAMVLDRFFLWVFTIACTGGTAGIILQAPSLYDTRVALDQNRSPGIPMRQGKDMRTVGIGEIDSILNKQ
ncbi:Similar to nAChRbeta2: Acetylcholine receptor subunit beta-like 2 (Drosophila melanogaster) [Cotesia congregata]|uniref:Similar to nAChRbeta2: Acetylcholine receptor subunit beta-like 2 (Drosophila melanogaster) n=1 Tax=Cotesia congregata TaxID=51543 RepID=A0A8J2HG18_COTCN|nr:Similar to nAChRbeta2: Acetylcholine receptor subunit beta-like 2 (Drosophila melanogaster) [Cotesia congregata]